MSKLSNLIVILSIFVTTLLAQEGELQSISLQLKWKHQFQFAGFYMAKERGFYKDVGLDVEIFEYEEGMDIIGSVLSGKRDFALGYPSLILDKTERKEIVLLAALLQSSPHVLVSLDSSGLESIKDFKNKKLMITDSATYTASFVSMLHSNGLEFSDLQKVEPNLNVESLLSGRVDIITAYRSNELYTLHKQGSSVKVWDPKEYGFDFYDDLLFTSQKELKEHPERVKLFREATIRGFEYAYEHIEESIATLMEKYNTQNKSTEALLYEAETLKRLAYIDENPLGSIQKQKVQRIIDVYNFFGRIKQQVNLDEFLYTPERRDLYLSRAEQEYLLNKREITLCIDPDWMPFEKFEDGQHIGMSAEYFKLLQKNLPIEFRVLYTESWQDSLESAKSRKCDILSLAMETPERAEYLNFTKPYLEIPLVMATKVDAPFVTDFLSLEGKKIGIPHGYAFLELLQNRYKNIDFVEVDNLKDGLNRVTQGNLYGYVGTLATIGYSFQKEFTGELKIAGKFDGTWNLGIGVRNDDKMLFDILQKSVASISPSQKQKILNNWLAIKYEKSIDYYLIFEIIFVFVLLLLIVGLYSLRERKLKKDLEINHILLESIINTIPNPLFYKDKNGVYQNVNSAFSYGVLGVARESVIGKTLYDLESDIPKELAKLYEEQDEKLYREGSSQEYEAQVQLQDGRLRDFQINKMIFRTQEGELIGYVGIMTDITELKEKEKNLKELASIDPLSKLYNRRYFSETAKDILNLAKREKSPLSIVMLDIDNFKIINDTYGHDIGDRVIIRISKLLNDMSRVSDIACRFGGEEFVLLLPKTDSKGAFVIAEKIREAIEGISLSIVESIKLEFTVSVGVSEVKIEEESDIEFTIKRADMALYEAKNQGKNRVSLAL